MSFLKMALATEADVNVAYDMAGLLEAVDRGLFPATPDSDDDGPKWFDEDDYEHLKALHKRVAAIAENYGSIWRLLGGWSCVTNPKNELLDLTQDTVEFHPRLIAAREALDAQDALAGKAFADIRDERARQDSQWGGPAHDDQHTASDFLGYIQKQQVLGTLERVDEYPAEQMVRSRLVKIAALAVAAIEAIDRRAATGEKA
jgi:hypothetical protein